MFNMLQISVQGLKEWQEIVEVGWCIRAHNNKDCWKSVKIQFNSPQFLTAKLKELGLETKWCKLITLGCSFILGHVGGKDKMY